ncbi:MAG: dihydrofolate reductase, partial [Candidatus Marinimicrobia bacterium]|nr:dihydrofolate reductase [Candidatus Neomarinimicrobiota bacterium]
SIVISRTLTEAPGADVFPDIKTALNNLGSSTEKVFFAGGAGIYKEALELADTMLLSMMRFSVVGDIYFPDWDMENWTLESDVSYEKFNLHTYKKIYHVS